MDAKKSLGQHWLNNQLILEQIANTLDLKGTTVLEIGPGKGALTEYLVKKSSKVIALELDEDLIPQLKKRFGDSIELHMADVRKFNLKSLPRITK